MNSGWLACWEQDDFDCYFPLDGLLDGTENGSVAAFTDLFTQFIPTDGRRI
jgi:hypothetical protein